MNRKLTLLIIFCLMVAGFTNELQAQMSFGFNFNYTQALGDYDKNLAKDPKGLTIGAFYNNAKLKNWSLGMEFGVAMYANDVYNVEIENGPDGFDEIEIDEEDCYFKYNANARYYMIGKERRLNPYLDLHAGAMSFFSTRIYDSENVEYIDSQTEFHGSTLMLGVGGGLIYRLGQNVSLDLNVVANRGNKTYYRSIEPNDANLKHDLGYGQKESFTHNIAYELGVHFGF